MARHDDREARACTVAVEKHLASMCLDRAMHHREAEPGPARLGREERVEEAVTNVAWDAGTVVAHTDRNALLAFRVIVRRRLVIQRSSLDSHFAFRRRRLNRIE